jgi:signal peptidase
MSTHRADHTSVRGWLIQVMSWFVMSAVLLVLAVSVLIPRLGGATPYTILTGSMQPGMPPGTLVVVKPVDVSEIALGTVITYQLESGKPTVVTHRVVGLGYDGQGRQVFRTQGDANNAPDTNAVLPVQIKGARWYSIPYLGYVTNVLTSSQRQMALMVIVVGLFAYAAVMFAGAGLERRPRKQDFHV